MRDCNPYFILVDLRRRAKNMFFLYQELTYHSSCGAMKKRKKKVLWFTGLYTDLNEHAAFLPVAQKPT